MPACPFRKRIRPPTVLSEEEEDEMATTVKAYSAYRASQRLADRVWLNRAIARQDKALKALKELSPHLYEQAIQPDLSSLPLHANGPTLTPPIDGYEIECPVDGEY